MALLDESVSDILNDDVKYY